MQRIDVAAFQGMAPRVSPALLENSQGVEVVGTVTSGELRPWRVPAYLEDCPVGTEGMYLAQNGDWLTWNEPVSIHPSVAANDAFGRVYYTRESGGLFVVSPLDEWTEFRVGVPAPETAPVVAITGSGSGTIEDRVYVYTYVNDFGEEGPPSPPSTFHEWQPGKTSTVSDFAVPPLGFKLIVAIRLYRMAIGDTGAEWFLVQEFSTEETEYVDTIADLALGEAISTKEYDLPQESARGLVPLGNGIFATFEGNEVAFSEPYLPYAWPDGFRMTVAGGVVALGVSGATVSVLTSISPYYIHTAHPSMPVLSPQFFSQVRLSEITPCLSPRAVVSTPHGVLFPAPDGLRVLRGEGPSQLLTKDLLTAAEWVSMFNPLGMQGIYFDATYFGFYANTGFAYQVEMGLLTWTGMGASAMHTDGLYLYVAQFGEIRRWGADTALSRGVFRSKVFRYQRPMNLSAIRVDSSMGEIFVYMQEYMASVKTSNQLVASETLTLAEEEILAQSVAGNNLFDLPYDGGGAFGLHQVRVWADGDLVFDGGIPAAGFARLPAGFLAREWQFEIRSYSHIKQVSLGTSVRALMGGGGEV